MRPKVNEVTWDYYYKLRYIVPGSKDKIKYFYGETAWMDITRFIRDLGDWSFNIDSIEDDLLDSYLNTLVDLKGSC